MGRILEFDSHSSSYFIGNMHESSYWLLESPVWNGSFTELSCNKPVCIPGFPAYFPVLHLRSQSVSLPIILIFKARWCRQILTAFPGERVRAQPLPLHGSAALPSAVCQSHPVCALNSDIKVVPIPRVFAFSVSSTWKCLQDKCTWPLLACLKITFKDTFPWTPSKLTTPHSGLPLLCISLWYKYTYCQSLSIFMCIAVSQPSP